MTTATIRLPDSTRSARPGSVGPRVGERRLAWALGLVAFAISIAGSWIPSFWGDEAASLLSAQRPLPSLFAMLGNLDAVHGTYYLGLHFWIEVFGASPLSVRLPSAIAVGLASVGTYFVVRHLSSRRLAVAVAVVFAVIPRVTSFGIEARAYAVDAAIAAWLMYALIRLVTRGSTGRRAWAVYGAVLALGIYAFLYFGLFVVVTALVLVQARVSKATWKRWAQATGAALVVALPVIVYGLAQHGQVGFLSRQDTFAPDNILVTTWFGSVGFAVVAWALIAAAVAFLVSDIVKDRRIQGARVTDAGHARSVSLTVVGIGWLLGPLAVLWLGHFVVPDFTSRYVSYSTPGAAILMATGIVRVAGLLRRNLARLVALAVGVAVVIGLATPVYADQRTPYAKNDSDWQSISEVVGAHATAGDAVVFDESTKPSILTRLAKYTYPEGFAGLRDVTLKTPYADSTSWHDSAYTVEKALELGRFEGTKTVWLVEYATASKTDDYGLAQLEAAGYSVVTRYSTHRSSIIELVKS